MSCKDISAAYIGPCIDGTPKGNTYTIEIGPNDKLLVTVKHKGGKTHTLISHIGMSFESFERPDGKAEIIKKSEFRYRNVENYKKRGK